MNFKDAINTINSPLLSVVMPVYNGEQYLGEAIKSVLAQTYSNFEFIIINDGSNDDTELIIKNYQWKDPRIKSINLKQNGGISNALNVGIDFAHGDYIVRMDCDDIITTDKFSRQVEYFREHKEKVDVLGSYFCFFYDNSIDRCKMVPAYAHDVRNGKSPVHHPTCMIRRNIFQKYGKYNSKYDNAEDVEMWFRWYSQGVKFDNIPEVLYKKRIHEGSVSVARVKNQTYLLLKINIIAIFKYRIGFTVSGYKHVIEQFLYFIYLVLRLDRIYVRKKSVYAMKRKVENPV